MFEPIRIAPSLLSADFTHLGQAVKIVKDAGAYYAHIDVMDGHFVPNLTMGVPVIKSLAGKTSLILDVHLMISNPLRQIPWYIAAGADSITVHAEATTPDELVQAMSMIKEAGKLAAVTVCPETSISLIEPVIEMVDMVLVMSVRPGFSGQSYIEGSEDKVRAVVDMAKRHGVAPLIEVDGGIGVETAERVVRAGADVLVCGNAVFGAPDPAQALKNVYAIAEAARADEIKKVEGSSLDER